MSSMKQNILCINTTKAKFVRWKFSHNHSIQMEHSKTSDFIVVHDTLLLKKVSKGGLKVFVLKQIYIKSFNFNLILPI